MNFEEVLSMSAPYLLVALGVWGASILFFWLLIYSAVRAALQSDREKALDKKLEDRYRGTA